MQYFVLGIALLLALLFLGRWFVEAEPRKVAGVLKWGGLGVIVGAALLLLLSGRFGLILLLVPIAFWLRRFFDRFKAAQGPSAGQSSEVRTRFLRMRLDHDSGDMDGEVLDGRYSGQLLSQLSLPELLDLLQEYQIADEQSASVLEAYLDRTQPDWRDAAAAGGRHDAGEGRAQGGGQETGGRGPAGAGTMTRAEALEILDLEEGADPEAIREAHRRLMQKLHPDHGGSNYLAAKLNQAKDLLLRR
ncbi:molecular chaperone DnaJ [Pelagibius marinus]|uniref:molecular chaperone DnaJ n=1 Tax=Pelagibius marinus TaxID=2762760 RepID=UPI0018730891|nr:molecular chaperone DnaJ [Pelagibius marinus]